MVDLKIFSKNTVIYAIGNIGLRISSFLLLPLYTHTLKMEEYGALATLLMTIQILLTLMGLGTRRAFIRFASDYEKKRRLGVLFSSTLFLNLLGGVVVTGLALVLVPPLFRTVLHFRAVNYFIILTCGVALSQSLFLNIINYYRARNNGLKFVFSGLTAALFLILITSFFLVILKAGLAGVLIAQIITYSTIGGFIAAQILAKTGIGVSAPVLKRILSFGFPLVFAMTADLVLDTSALYFLGYFTDLRTVAIYSIGYKLAQIGGMVLILPFQLAFEPFVFANLDKPNLRIMISRLLTYLLLAFVFVALGIVFASRKVLGIIAPPEYSHAYVIIFLLLPGIAFKGIHYVGQALLHIKKKSYITGLTAFSFTLLSFLLNYLLIRLFGMYGAVGVFNFTLIGSAMVLLFWGRKMFYIPLEKKRLFIIGTVAFLLLFVVFLLKNVNFYIYYSVIPLLTLLVVSLLLLGNFFNPEEKDIIFGFLQRIYRPAST